MPSLIEQRPTCAPSRTAPRHYAPSWQNSTSRSFQPSAHWLTPKHSTTASWWRTRLRRWLRQSNRLPRELMPVPPRSWRLSQKARRQCRKQPGSRLAWMRCAVRFSRLQTCFAGSYGPPRCARAGNANIVFRAPLEPEQPPPPEIDQQLIYTLNPLLWREGSEVRRVPAFAVVGLPKMLLPAALRHQRVEYLNARRVQILMHVHGGGGFNSDPDQDDPQLVDLDALAAEEKESAQADVA